MVLQSQLLTATQVKALRWLQKETYHLYKSGQMLHTFQVWCVVAHCQLPYVSVHWDSFMLV